MPVPATQAAHLPPFLGRNRRPPRTAQETVLRELRRAIVVGDIAPGDHIRQESFVEQLGVSHVPVREALKILSAEGLVQYEPNRGFTVPLLSASELREIVHLSEVLEAEATVAAVPKLDDAAFDTLEALVDAMESALANRDFLAFLESNRDFHFTIYAYAGLPRLLHILDVLWQSSAPYLYRFVSGTGYHEVLQRQHREILTACRSGDVDAVLAVEAAHRRIGVDELAAELEQTGGH